MLNIYPMLIHHVTEHERRRRNRPEWKPLKRGQYDSRSLIHFQVNFRVLCSSNTFPSTELSLLQIPWRCRKYEVKTEELFSLNFKKTISTWGIFLCHHSFREIQKTENTKYKHFSPLEISGSLTVDTVRV